MISYREAQGIIAEQVHCLPTESIRSGQALGRVLAEPVTSPINLPSFDNTAMDGFAIASKGVPVPVGSAWDVLGEQAAGDGISQATTGCWEIMTGARIPDGYDAVIPIEQVRITQLHPDGRPARIESTDIALPGQHVRRTGEDIAHGDIAMQAGERLAAQHVMLLAGLGISH
ncbi:MAG TPA: molybdopterin molybdenumtransferase MoeA, partial [Alcaligenaceae bacterium]|nr:molybdopterin molybdenumtransferase MoeA [Alcaligenaceae bacterium]